MPKDESKVRTVTFIYAPPPGSESWGIQPLDLASVSEDVRKALTAVLELQPGRVPIEIGVFGGPGVEILASELRNRFMKEAFSVAQASTVDLQYYWLLNIANAIQDGRNARKLSHPGH